MISEGSSLRSSPANTRKIAAYHSKISYLRRKQESRIKMTSTLEFSKEAKPLLCGSCQCKKVGFRILSPPRAISFCHCITCRKLSSNPFLAFGNFDNNAINFTIEGGTSVDESIILRQYSDIAKRGFCRDCNSQLFMKYHCTPDKIHLCLGLIDNEPYMNKNLYVDGQWRSISKEHIFLRGAEMSTLWGLGGLPFDDGTPDDCRHAEFDEGFTKRLQEWEQNGRPERDDV